MGDYESEGSRRQISGLTNINYIRNQLKIKLQYKSKYNNCSKLTAVNRADGWRNIVFLPKEILRTIKDGRVISLIHKYLRAGAMVNQRFEETQVGLAQVGKLCPLFSNIMHNELDKELEKIGVCFARYADDVLLFAKYKQSTSRIMAQILPSSRKS